ncbi:hypothetical protein D3C80_1446070 [compost metagenome]
MHHRFRTIGHQVIAVVECFHFHVGRKGRRVQFFNLLFHARQNFARIFPFSHHHDSFYHIVVFPQTNLANSWRAGFLNGCNVFNQQRIAVENVNDRVFNVGFVVQKPDSSDDVSLTVFLDYITTYIQIRTMDGVI